MSLLGWFWPNQRKAELLEEAVAERERKTQELEDQKARVLRLLEEASRPEYRE